jgi:hypothetical protein
VPLTVLRGPLSVVAATEFGDWGSSQSEPAEVPWRWHHHLLGFAGWALIGALLIVVKENRRQSAWLILVPFLLLSEIVWPWIVRLLSLPSDAASRGAVIYQSFVVAWTAVWLLGPWLARHRPAMAFLLALAVIAIVAISAEVGVTFPLTDERLYVHVCGYRLPDIPLYLRLHGHRFTSDAMWLFPLPVAFALSAVCCRKNYRPRRFMIWLGLWLVVAIFATNAFLNVFQHVYSCLSRPPGMPTPPILPVLAGLPRLFVGSVFPPGVIIYLLNLPLMYLAMRCPEYRDRFHKVLRLPVGWPRPESSMGVVNRMEAPPNPASSGQV